MLLLAFIIIRPLKYEERKVVTPSPGITQTNVQKPELDKLIIGTSQIEQMGRMLQKLESHTRFLDSCLDKIPKINFDVYNGQVVASKTHGMLIGDQLCAVLRKMGWVQQSQFPWSWYSTNNIVQGEPDLLNDPNAIHDAEMLLTDKELVIYMEHLHKIHEGPYGYSRATLSERLECLCRTWWPEKWKA